MSEVVVFCEHCGRKTYAIVEPRKEFECPGCNKKTLRYQDIHHYNQQVREGKVY